MTKSGTNFWQLMGLTKKSLITRLDKIKYKILILRYNKTVSALSKFVVTELLQQPSLQTAPVLLVYTKTDLDSARSISEFKSLMRLEDIKQHSGQEISVLEFTTEDKEKLGPVLDWCLKYKTVPFAHMNGSSY